MTITAADVKKLRDLTDAPMMECKQALVEAEGDIEKAVEILRKKGQAAAAKRAGRGTSEGVARVALSADGSKVGGVVVECETDFVANNADFKAMVEELAQGLAAGASVSAGEVKELDSSTEVNGKSLQTYMEEAVAKIRENIQLRKAVVAGAPAPGGIGIYNHHTGKAAAFTLLGGSASNLSETGLQVSIQSVAFPAAYLKREDVPADEVEKQIGIETERAVNEGKTPEVARKVAEGRVQKEYFQSAVLLEQPFYLEPKKKTGDYVGEQGKAGGGAIEVVSAQLLKVGG